MELHPAIVHFPIALLTIAALFAVLSLFSKKDLFKQVAFWNLLIGVIAGAVAVLTGLMEERDLVHTNAIHQVLEKHEFNGFAILIFSFALLTWIWVRKNKVGKGEYLNWVIGLVFLTASVFYQGYLGGKMVFEQGAGVKPMEIHLAGDSTSKHDHSNSAHDHNDVTGDSLSNKTSQQKMPHSHSGKSHAHSKQDTLKKQDNKTPKLKTQLCQ